MINLETHDNADWLIDPDEGHQAWSESDSLDELNTTAVIVSLLGMGTDPTILDTVLALLGQSSSQFYAEVEGLPASAEDEVVFQAEIERIRLLMATNSNTPQLLLDQLAMENSHCLRERVAENPRTSPNTLARLSFDINPEVRAAVSENLNTPVEILMMLAGDECVDVRYRLAENSHIPLELLHILANDENPYIAHRAKKTLERLKIVEPEREPVCPVPIGVRKLFDVAV